MSVLAYTALKVTEPGIFKANVGFSLAVRVQIILNGQPVDNREIIELQPGIYPMLLAVRMDGASWGHIEPHFTVATDEEIAAGNACKRIRKRPQLFWPSVLPMVP